VISFESSVRVERTVDEVFDFVSDPLLFPRWNSAVQAVNNTSGATGDVGSTYSMRRELPTGQVENDLEVLVRERPSEFVIRTTSGPTPFLYHYRFASEGAGTVVHLQASVEQPGVAGVLGPLAARAVRRGVDANFTAVQRILGGSARDAQSASA
jgi:Polyketide cyclase / dehydrase and lipid transport